MTPERRAVWRATRRILAVRLDGMGDLLMTTPALRGLKQAAAGREIIVLTSPAGAAAARLVPEIDEVIEYEAPWMKASQGDDPLADSALIETLRAKSFDAAVIFTLHSQSSLPAALVCYFAGIPLRLARSRENPYHLLSDWVKEDELTGATRHDVRRQLDLVARTDAGPRDERLSLAVPARSAEWAAAVTEDLQLSATGQPWAVIHPGASATSRRYPPEFFAAAARELASNHGWRFLVTGSDAESELKSEVTAAIGPSATSVDTASLADFAGLIARAPLLITNNTGPVHVAAAVGTPVVDIYALTNPQHTPWQVPHRTLSHDVPCRDCYRSVCPEGHNACIRMVAPAEVARAALSLMYESPPPGRIGEPAHV